MKGQGKSRLKLAPSIFHLELFFVHTQKYVDTYCIRLSSYITPNIDNDFDDHADAGATRGTLPNQAHPRLHLKALNAAIGQVLTSKHHGGHHGQ